MIDESFEIKPDQPTVPYKMIINIVVHGKAPVKEGNFPYLPISFFEYIQRISQTYENKFKDDGFFVIVSLGKNEEILK